MICTEGKRYKKINMWVIIKMPNNIYSDNISTIIIESYKAPHQSISDLKYTLIRCHDNFVR